MTMERQKIIFMTAMKSDPLYPHPYFHLAALLMDMERLDELEQPSRKMPYDSHHRKILGIWPICPDRRTTS